MKHLLLLTALIFGGIFSAHSQKYSVNGHVKDTTGAPLPFATIAVLSPADSVMQGFAVSDKQGLFVVELKESGSYLLKIVLVGYATINEQFELSDSTPVFNAGDVVMTDDQVLKAIDITAEHIPVLIKEDTVEYNAEAFKTDPNAPVEDMLTKMPGIEIDKDGNIKAHGEDVDKIFVDGKEFFGDDPKVATKNLPADAVKKVQVYDRKSETAEFTGVDDGQRNKTINIELKEDKKRGVFGNVTGGYGTEDRFKFKASVNKFNKKNQFSLLGLANNTSEEGFSWEDYVSFMGGMQNMSRGSFRNANSVLPISNGLGDGNIATGSIGLNWSHEFRKNSDLNISYFSYRSDKYLDKQVLRNNFLDTITYVTDENSEENTIQWVHRANIRFEHEIDSMNSLLFTSSIDYRTDDYLSVLRNETTYENRELINSGDRTNSYEGFSYSGNANLNYMKKFKKTGRNMDVSGGISMTNSDYQGLLNNISLFVKDTATITDTLNQSMFEDNYNLGYNVAVTYTEPLGKNRFLQLKGGYDNENENSDYDVYDYMFEPQYNTRNTFLSSHFRKGYSAYYSQGAFRWIKDKFNINPGVMTKWMNLQGTDELRDTLAPVNNDYFAVLPFFTLNWNPRQTTRFRFRYTTDLNIPTIEQLQNRVDNSNPFNIVIGNPELDPEYQHNINLHGGSFSQFSMSGFYAGLRGTYTKDKIQYASMINEFFVNITQPINVDQDFSASSYGGFYAPINKLGIKFNIFANGGLSRGFFFINGVENQSFGKSASLDISIENKKKDKIDIIVGGSYGVNVTEYDQSTFASQSFTNITFFAELRWKITEKLSFRTEYGHEQYTSNAFDEVTIIPLLKASMSRYLGKTNRGEVRFEAFDILNQNRGLSRTITYNYYQETRTNSIGRYYMLAFTYNLNKMGSEKKDSMFRMRHR